MKFYTDCIVFVDVAIIIIIVPLHTLGTSIASASGTNQQRAHEGVSFPPAQQNKIRLKLICSSVARRAGTFAWHGK